MRIREAAERVLFGTSLDEKLAPAPADASDDAPGNAIVTPGAPGRPRELAIRDRGVTVKFPGVNRLDDERERGVLLHFLANHELLAAELMALVLLKFPDAPPAYRAGVYAAMREEQMHAKMYLRRMRECGIAFGELPLNNFFWRLVAPVETPMEFVTRLNLTFEQANLDFSKHYAALFREVGDTGTAAVLEKIYQDEIGHVSHGVKWFRHWKNPEFSDWRAFCGAQRFPLTAARAKGIAPFNREGRRLAGLDEDFIRRLEVHEQSRGRTPAVCWFNPNAESEVAAKLGGIPYHPNRHALALEEDLEILTLAWCRKDDVALMRNPPSNEHLSRLKVAGFDLPEILPLARMDDLAGRKLGGLRPWAWSPDASRLLEKLAPDISPSLPWQWREPLPAAWLSKEIGLRLEEMLGIGEGGTLCRSVDETMERIDALTGRSPALVKAAYACAGKGHFRVDPGACRDATRAWLAQALAKNRAVVVEPWLRRLADFSALYEMDRSGIRLVGMTVMENDAAGRFLGSSVAHKWGSMLPPEVAAFLFKEAEVMAWYEERIPAAVAELLHGYTGPFGVDAMVHLQAEGSLSLRPVVELNVRMTMGRIALEIRKRPAFRNGGTLRIVRKRDWAENTGLTPLSEPERCREFVAAWQHFHPKV